MSLCQIVLSFCFVYEMFQSDFDKEHLGNVTYIPEAGIDGKYYPYAVMPNYHQPIVSFQNDFVECLRNAQ